MDCCIRNYDSKDEGQIKKILDLCFEDEGLISILNSKKLMFAYSAFIDKELVGIVFGWSSNFHPYCTYFRLLSNPYYKAINIEGKLLSKVKEQEMLDFPLQTVIWESSFNLKCFYEDSGFIELRRTYMPILKLSDVNKELLLNRSEIYTVMTLGEVSLNHELMKKLILLVKRNYEHTHKVNPVANLGLEEWRKLILADDTLMEGSYIYIDISSMEIIAYSFLHKSEKEDSYELGWCGATECLNTRLILQLILHQVKYSLKEGILYLIGEFDTTDKYSIEVLKVFPFSPCPTKITYQKKQLQFEQLPN